MNPFTTIAGIEDKLNTRHLTQEPLSRFGYRLITLVGSLASSLQTVLTTYATRLQQRRRNRATLVELTKLSARYLEDIGLQKSDLALLERGEISLDDLDAIRAERVTGGVRRGGFQRKVPVSGEQDAADLGLAA